MRIVIVGAGAIGGLFGSFLSRGGHDVIFVDPQAEIVDNINRNGIGLLELEAKSPDDVSFFPARAVMEGRQVQACDGVIISVKSYDTLTAINGVAHLVKPNSPILSIQTGLGNLENIQKVVPAENILGGFTFMAGTALGPGVVRQGGFGQTYIGELNNGLTPRVDALNRVFNSCGIESRTVKRIIGRLWCKVIIFAAINPLSAILRVRNGVLLDKMESVTLMKRLVDEGVAVAEACAIDLVYRDYYDLLFDACRRSQDNLSSMLQDFLNGKKTEIDSQNGELCRIGAEHKVNLPTHHTIIQIVKLLEMHNKGRDHDYLA